MNTPGYYSTVAPPVIQAFDPYDCFQDRLQSAGTLNAPAYSTTSLTKEEEQYRGRFKFINDDEFALSDYRPEWAIKNVLVRNQPAIIAAASKSLKTTLALEAALSMAAGVPWLGHFEVPHPLNVAFISGESGFHTLQETAKRMVEAKGIDRKLINKRMVWCKDLPTLSDRMSMSALLHHLVERKTEVLFIDPVYLSLGNVDPKNLFEMGEALKLVAEMLVSANITPILIHHSVKSVKPGQPMQLTDMNYTGFEQFGRQFIMLNRRKEYQHDGTHALWMSASGSFGHGGAFAVDVDEGLIDEHFQGRYWRCQVRTAAEVKGERGGSGNEDEKEREKAEKELISEAGHEQRVMRVVDAVQKRGGKAATLNEIKEGDGGSFPALSGVNSKKAIDRLCEKGILITIDFEKPMGKTAKRTCTGYCRPEGESLDHAEHAEHAKIPHDQTACSGEQGDHAGSCGTVSPPVRGIPVPHDRMMTPKKNPGYATDEKTGDLLLDDGGDQ
ncbi:hypothetical protein BH11PLA2_BH11PLA2_01760 [soil metagenome]